MPEALTEQPADAGRATSVMAGVSWPLDAERQRQLVMILVVALALGAVATMVVWLYEPPHRVLFNGLDNESSAQVMEALDRLGLEYKLDPRTGVLKVPENQFHQARLKLAAEGLPQSSGIGFELLDKAAGFGTTEFMETARYQRALEGELARSVAAIGSVQRARVHIAMARKSVFVRDRELTSASVIVHLHPGRVLDRSQVAAITHMVSSSVPDLTPERVTVVDQRGQLLSEQSSPEGMELSLDQLEYTNKLEAHYIKRIEEILTPIVGQGRVRAQVAVDVDFSHLEQTEEIFNGDRDDVRVRSEQLLVEKTERGPAAGIPGALSNQPPAPSRLGEDENEEDDATSPLHKRNETTRNYELDKRIRHTRRVPGALRRITAAVVVDDRMVTSESGDVTGQPIPTEEIERLTGLVKEAIGFDDGRGDRVHVVHSAFAPTDLGFETGELPLWEQSWLHNLVRMGLIALVAILVVLLVVRPLMRSLLPRPAVDTDDQLRLDDQSDGDVRVLTSADGELSDDVVQLGSMASGGGLVSPDVFEQQLAQVKSLVAEDPRRAVQVVKNWMDEDGSDVD